MSWQRVVIVGLLVLPAIGALAVLAVPERRAVPVGIAASAIPFAGTLALLLAWFHGSFSGSSA